MDKWEIASYTIIFLSVFAWMKMTDAQIDNLEKRILVLETKEIYNG